MRGLLVLVALAGVQAGCFYYPSRWHSVTDYGGHPSNIGWLYHDIKEGKSTRAEVTKLLGRRDVELAKGRVWVYSWEEATHSVWTMVVLFPNAGARDGAETRSAMRYILLEFNAEDVVMRKRLRFGGRINGLATCLDDSMMK